MIRLRTSSAMVTPSMGPNNNKLGSHKLNGGKGEGQKQNNH